MKPKQANAPINQKKSSRNLSKLDKDGFDDFLDGVEALSRIDEPSKDFKRAVNKIIKIKSLSA